MHEGTGRSTVRTARVIAGNVVLEAFRGRLAWMLGALVIVGIGVSELLASIAVTESREVARGSLGAWLRIGSVLVLSLFVVNSMLRDWQDKGLELVLSLPVPRAAYVLGRLFGYYACALAAATAAFALLAVTQPLGLAAAWSATLLAELLIVVSLSLLSVLTLSQAPIAMSVVIAFYLLARTMAAIQLMGASPLLGEPLPWLNTCLAAIGWLLPDLERFAPSAWLIEQAVPSGEVGAVLVHAAVYLAVLIAASLFDMERKVL